MNFFDGIIEEVEEILAPISVKSYPVDASWQDLGRNELVLQRDSAFELDGVGFNLVTSKDIEKDEIQVLGADLKELSADTTFSRISFIQMQDFEDEQKAYDVIRKVEYAKYHYFPKGYMVRTASSTHRENVRISKSALQSGLSFQKVGSLLIKKYKENPNVKAVKILFVTDKSVDYQKLEKLATKNYDITETLNHVMNNLTFDCNACNLKAICDEVEGMKELHFKNSKTMS